MDYAATHTLWKSKNSKNNICSYGFCLSEKNKFDSLKIRVVIGTAPEAPISNPADLLPSEKILSDTPNLETTTELLRIKPNKLSTGNEIHHILKNL